MTSRRDIARPRRGKNGGWLWLAVLATAVFSLSPAATAKDKDKEKNDPLGVTADLLAPSAETVWMKDVDAATERAREDRKPILICVTATWCPACRMLERALEEPPVREALKRWICVEIDAERQEDTAARLGVTGVPALRLQTPSGRPAGSHNGYLAAKELIDWLDGQYDEARAAMDDVLTESGQPLGFDVVKLVGLFDRRDPAVREAALRRLLAYPEVTRGPVVEAVRDGNLATRLAALELLAAWKAPVDGLDPWNLESLTEARLDALDRWAADTPTPKPEDLVEASEEELAAAAAEIDRMLGATDAEAEAIAERLARYGEQLLPAVQERQKTAAGDREQMLLRALRYRRVASNALAMSWPGGLWLLAATESEQRRKAAEELAKRATAQDQTLLLELFSDADPLVREISLRGLQSIGGAKSVAALTKLLSDPEPNVRAAVLKQLEEEPHKSMLPAVIAYLETETDADLLVHGIRFLRAVKDEKATRCMISLLDHERWQVRAEAAEGLGNSDAVPTFHGGRYYGSGNSAQEGLSADISVALLKLLEDPEPFVVAKALEGLQSVDMEVAVDYLVAAVNNHVSLADKIIEILARGQRMRPKALPHLVAFCKHEQPSVRAAAITGLAESGVATAEKQLLVGLKDSDASVRTAAANALFGMFDKLRESRADELREQRRNRSGAQRPFRMTLPPNSTLIGSIIRTLDGQSDEKAAPQEIIESAPAAVTDDMVLPEMPSPPTVLPAEESEPDVPAPETGDSEAPEKDGGKDDLTGIVWETWLEQFSSGKSRPKWTGEAVEPLLAMLAAEDPEQRAAAARALVPLAQSDRALPVLLAAQEASPALFEAACSVLPWLSWDRRYETYQALRPHVRDAGMMGTLVEAACSAPDRRVAEPLWNELADDTLDENIVRVLQQGLMSAYSGSEYYWSSEPLPPAAVRDFRETARKLLDSGGLLQRLVALAFCSRHADDEGRPKAEAFFHDKQAPNELQIASARYLLLTASKSEAARTAVSMLDDDREEVRAAALASLAECNVADLGHGVWANGSDIVPFESSDGKPIVPLPPPGLKIDDILPRYGKETNDQIHAYLGYLLALFGDGRGLDDLIEYWRGQSKVYQVQRLVYRAIASLNDASKVPVLEEIYEGIDTYRAGDLYWTIRIMSGAEVLRLRKRIRDEVGISQLQ